MQRLFVTLLALIASILAIFSPLITAQRVSTEAVALNGCNGVTTYTPALASTTACATNSDLACQIENFKPGYPNTYGNLALPSATGAGPFKFKQKLTQDPMYVILSDSNGVAMYKTRFFLEVDRYTLMELKGSAGNPLWDIALQQNDLPIDAAMAAQMEAVSIAVEFGGFAVPPVKRARVTTSGVAGELPTNKRRGVVPFYTLVVELDRGYVKSFAWEKGCWTCKGDQCWEDEQQCTIPYSTCSVVDADSSVDCNIKIYVGWQGTDKDGNYLMSAQKTVKSFLRFDLSTPFEDATRTFTDLSPGGNDGYY